MTGRLFTKQRQQVIAEVIAREGQATVEALCQLFDVSPATIRRDLDELDTQGSSSARMAARCASHRRCQSYRFSSAAPTRWKLSAGSAKPPRRLSRRGQLYLLRRGQPRWRSRALASRANLTVITNALNIACLLTDAPGVTLDGAGIKSDDVLRLIEFTHPHEANNREKHTALEDMRRVVKDELHEAVAEHGGDRTRGQQGNNVTLDQRGNSEDYALRRLRRDRPDLADRVIAKELSANAAAIQAGFRPKTPW